MKLSKLRLLSAAAMVFLVSAVCVGQMPLNREMDRTAILEDNVRLLMELRTGSSQVGARGWFSGLDQPEGILLWNWQGIDDTECVSSIGDVNSDGFPDVLAENYDAGASGNNFTCLSGHSETVGDVVWSVHPTGGPSNSGGYGDHCVNSISDISGDGVADALLGTAWGGRTVFAINGATGTTLWSYDTYNDPVGSGWVYAVAPIPDVNNDGVDDVLAGVGSACRSAFCFSGSDGTMLWRLNAQDAIGSVHAISDVNGDSIPDALASAWGNSADRKVYCISGASSGSATVLWNYQTGGDVQHVTSIPDVNNNGSDDVIAASWDDNVYCLDGSSGALIWSHPLGGYASRAESVPDVDGDDVWDVIAGGWSNTVVMISGDDGLAIWTQSLPGSNSWSVNKLGDVNGDDINDVIIGNSVSGGTGGTLFCLSGSDGEIIWDYVTNGWINTVRGIEDISGDLLYDVIAGNQGGPGAFVWCFEGDTLEGGVVPPDLKISEFLVVTGEDEAVEIYNPTQRQFALDDWMIIMITIDDADTVVIDSGVTITAGEYKVVDYTITPGVFLPDDGAIIKLSMPDGMTIDSVGYGYMGGAPAPPIEWSTALDINNIGSWAERFSVDATPTLGSANDLPTADLGNTAVVLNEVYPLEGEGDAFIELYNVTSQPVDISGWQVLAGTDYQVPPDVTINGNGYFVLWENDFPMGFGLQPEGDNVYLMDADGVRLDQMGYWFGWVGDSSWSVIPDGDRNLFEGYDLVTSPDFERAVPTPNGLDVPEGGDVVEVRSFRLGPVYPNPFNASTQIQYSLGHRGVMSLMIYDVLGREVATLVTGMRDAGMYSVNWQADGVSSGTYFAVLKAVDRTQTLKLTLLK